MDKFFNTPMFVRIISLLLAIMLYLAVTIETPGKQSGQNPLPGTNQTGETLLDVSLDTYYDENKYVVDGIPSNVTVSVSGPSSTITTTKLKRNYEVFLDLQGLEPGEHQVNIQHKNFSEKLNVGIEPDFVTVTIHEKVSEIMQVDVDFIKKQEIEEGYTVEQPIVSPNSVKVTGARGAVEAIALVKAIVDLDGVNETVTVDAPIKVYDQDGNELDVMVEPSVVEVKVPVSSPSKVVPFKINRKGKLPGNISINSIEVTPSEVTVYGPLKVLDQIEFIDNVTVDLSQITEDTTLELEIPVPRGAKKVDPEKVKVTIDVEEKQEKEFSNVPIKIEGLSNDLTATFAEEDKRTSDITIFGTEEVLKDINLEDIEVYVDLSDYAKGIHEVDIKVNGSQNITWALNRKTVKIEIK